MAWIHTPRTPFLIWIIYTFPFTIWDALYIALRPRTLPGHEWHAPIWKPFAKYAAVDGVYGEAAWLKGEGWTAAQGVINVTEVALYLWYFWIVQRRGDANRRVGGADGGLACVVGLVAGTVTLTKSALYLMRECFSGFEYVGGANWKDLASTWGFMNVIYLGMSSYMIITFSRDIIGGLALLDVEKQKGPARQRKQK